MKKKTIIPIYLLLLLGIGLLFFIRSHYHFFTYKNKARAYHNSLIKQAQEEVTEIQIESLLYKQYYDYPEKAVTVTNSDQIKMILSYLKLPLQLDNSGPYFHRCAGHILFIVQTGSGALHIQYDHGEGIYPLLEEPLENDPMIVRPGFLYLSRSSIKDLSNYLKSLGFTEKEIGVE